MVSVEPTAFAEANDLGRREMTFNHQNSPQPELLTTKQAARLLNVSTAFLERDRWAGKRTGSGPLIPYTVVGARAVRYDRDDLHSHIERHRKRSHD